MAEAISKAQAIRDHVAQNKKATAEQVVKALADKGIQVTVRRVYDVKSKTKPKRKRAAKAAGESATVESETVSAVERVGRTLNEHWKRRWPFRK